MTLELHPAVQGDVNEAFAYYGRVAPTVVSRFSDDLDRRLAQILSKPKRFSFLPRHPDLRRARLESFPYIIIYRELPTKVFVVTVRHERRHPDYGLTRI
jgi:toxin ParE1/3/4